MTGSPAISIFADGIMHTDDLLIAGPALSMKVRGDSDAIRKRYDQHIDVVPNLSSSLPVTSALLGGPIAGAVVYLLDKLTDVGSRVNEILTLRYHLHGDWESPQIDFEGVPAPKKVRSRRRKSCARSFLEGVWPVMGGLLTCIARSILKAFPAPKKVRSRRRKSCARSFLEGVWPVMGGLLTCIAHRFMSPVRFCVERC